MRSDNFPTFGMYTTTRSEKTPRSLRQLPNLPRKNPLCFYNPMTLQRMEGQETSSTLEKVMKEPILPADKFITPPSTDGTNLFYSMYSKIIQVQFIYWQTPFPLLLPLT